MTKRIITDAERESVLAALRHGQSVHVIAKQHRRDQKTIKRIAADAGVSLPKPKGGPDCRLGAILMGYRTGTRVAVDLTPNERRAQLIVRLRAKHGPRARGWFRNRQIGGAMG
jgi:hypothetical protein